MGAEELAKAVGRILSIEEEGVGYVIEAIEEVVVLETRMSWTLATGHL